MKITSEPGRQALDIFYHALKAVDPSQLVRERLRLEGSSLKIDGRSYNLREFDEVHVLGIGKASASMAQALEKVLGEWLKGGIVVVKEGHSLPLGKIKILEAGHPIPDRRSQEAARALLNWAEGLGEKDLVFCLISGGGSTLLCAPPEGISLEDVRSVTTLLLACGAKIKEINTLRKHLSLIHGGRLARALYPATVVNLVISDVVDNVLDIVSSGPTLPDPSTFEEALEIVSKYELEKVLPERAYEYLKRGATGEVEETPKEGDTCFQHAHTFLIGSNMKALEAAKEKAVELGYNTLILGSSFIGEAREVGKVFSSIAKECKRSGNPLPGPACLLAGGEPTVTLRGSGKGGRNQEFALACAIEIEGIEGIVIFSGGTDGNDGPTEAAGAVVDGTTCGRARELGIEPDDYLRRNDSYTFFSLLGDHIITGPTCTNVMDIMLCLIGSR